MRRIAAREVEGLDALATDVGTKLDADGVLAVLAAALTEGDNVTLTVNDDGTITIASTGGGGPATTRWEVLLDGTVDNPQPILTPDGTGWIYVEVPL